MCGIAGLWLPASSPDEVTLRVSAQCARIRHRGPDGGGIASRGELAIGMTRLAIVDLERGKQPMYSADGRLALVYNGEIYNAPELRKELEDDGVRFETHSDTEVLLRLLERDPEHVEERLVGMWAFAVHDARAKTLTLSRDRFGVKPLFLLEGKGKAIAFGSELVTLEVLEDRAEFASAFELDHGAAHAMLSWGYVPEQRTIYRGISRIDGGTRVTVDLDRGTRTTRRYYSLAGSSDAARVRTLDEAVELVEPALARAVHCHLESDVPIAAFLSGGVDSSLVLRYAAQRREIRAFSIGFTEPRFDESPYARETAERLGVPIEVSMLDENTAFSRIADVLASYDEPFGDSSSLATSLLSEVVGRTHKVALSGDGGDEVFAGYKKHRIIGVRRWLAHAAPVRDVLGRALAALPRRTDRSRGWTELLRTARRASRGLYGDDATAYVALTQVASLAHTAPLVRARNAGAEACEDVALARFSRIEGDQLRKTLGSDLANVLPNDMLTKVDRASMAHHLEARVPLLDHRLVEIGVGLPGEFTLGKRGKDVLRTLHERHFGSALAHRKKQGFGVPVEKWLRGGLDSACEYLFERRRLERHGLLDPAALSEGRHRTWAETDPQILWHAFALAAWCEKSRGDGLDPVRERIAGGAA